MVMVEWAGTQHDVQEQVPDLASEDTDMFCLCPFLAVWL